MKKTATLELIILFVAGLLPLLWFREGFFISSGDDFPLFLNFQEAFRSGTFLWSPDFLGYAVPTPAYALYLYLSVFLSYLGFSVGMVQAFFQLFLFLAAGFSMYYLAKLVYPNHRIAPFVAGFFYMFNFVSMQIKLNIGFLWIYAFIPLLLALLVRVVNNTYRQDNKAANKSIVYFALASVVAFSFASINPANVALILFSLAILMIFYTVKFRRQLRPLLKSLVKMAGLSVPINLWWLIPILNYYVFAPNAFNSEISVGAWIWTHDRASLLNLFWLNGFWGWLPEYVPFIEAYSNPFLAILTFAPFLIAGAALFFKSNKSRFNLYLMLAILAILFLAKGLHEPLGGLNLLLYDNVSLMGMFREPASKFTLLSVPFLALLIGYAVANLSNLRVKRIKPYLGKGLILGFTFSAFVLSAFPLITGPIETTTKDLPFSSYVKVPDYWYQAANWINNQSGEWKVLITPLNDYYQMPYTWGFYGTDQLIDRLIEKPLVSTANLNSYKVNPQTAATLEHLIASMKHGRTLEFKALLDLLNIKYIFQRNDVQTDLPDRNLISPAEMKAFVGTQPYIRLVHTFGEIDIYEYTESKPFVYALSPSALEHTDISVQTFSTLDKYWNFSLSHAVEEWNSTLSTQAQADYMAISQNGNYLRAEMSNSSSRWFTVESPLMPAPHGSSFVVRALVAGDSTSEVFMKIAEYAENMSLITNASSVELGSRSFPWWHVDYSFELKIPETKFFSIQFWNHFKANETAQSILWLDNVEVLGQASRLNTVGLEGIFADNSLNQTVLQAQRLSPTEIVVSVNATQPFILATSEGLDKFWVAYVDGERIESNPLYLGMQGFLIDKTGQFSIIVEYEPQNWFYYASLISVIALFALVAVFVYINRVKSVNSSATDLSNPRNVASISRLSKLKLWLLLWYKQKFVNLMVFKLKRELRICESFVELGCGPRSPAVELVSNIRTVGVDGYLPSLRANKKAGYFSDYILADLLQLPLRENSFDCVAAFDVVEHLTKPQANHLIEVMEKVSVKKVIISTPNGFNPKFHLEDNNPFQVHKCGWTMSEFSRQGYTVFGFDGLRSLRGEFASATIKPVMLGGLISRLTDPIVYFFPAGAFQLLCIKNKR